MRLLWLPVILGMSLLLACQEGGERSDAGGSADAAARSAAESAAGPAAPTDPAATAPSTAATDPEKQAQLARLEEFYSTVGERSRRGCAGFVGEDAALAERCNRDLEQIYRDVGRRVEQSPARWEQSILGLATTCLRGAGEHSKSEGTGKSSGELFLEGLLAIPACLDEQMAALAKGAEAAAPAGPQG
jgi:hypothetical protein